MYKKIIQINLVFISFILFANTLAFSKDSNTTVPLPEFFGLNILDNGKLFELTELVNKNQFNGEPIIDPQKVKTDVQSETSSFVLYTEDPSDNLSNLTVDHHNVVFVCNQIRQILFPRQDQIQRLDQIARVGLEESIKLRTKPIGKKKGMYQIVPEKPLKTGLYTIDLNQKTSVFYVNKEEFLKNVKKVDVVYEASPMGLADRVLDIRPCGN